jgi:uncharacterized metal-binding protein
MQAAFNLDGCNSACWSLCLNAHFVVMTIVMTIVMTNYMTKLTCQPATPAPGFDWL